jgi:hypothetical protein
MKDKDLEVGPSTLVWCSFIVAVGIVDEPDAWDLCFTSPSALVCLTQLY